MSKILSEFEYLREVYSTARRKYFPRHVRVLLVTEAPPSALDRHFYFEDVKTHDSLFLEIMGLLYPDLKRQYLASRRDTSLKADLLETFKSDGYWLIDVYETPTVESDVPVGQLLSSFLGRIERIITKETCIVLIKASIYDLCYDYLASKGYNVIDERIPFPGSGQQGIFRKKFKKVIRSCG